MTGAGAAAAGGVDGGDGWLRVGWVRVGGSTGAEPGPDGGARFIAGPPGASGTEAGGTGGGRSENIWAETATGIDPAKTRASASAAKSRPPRPHPLKP